MPEPRPPLHVIALAPRAVHQLVGDPGAARFAAAVREREKGDGKGDPARRGSRVVVSDGAAGTDGRAMKVRGLQALAFTADGAAVVASCRASLDDVLMRLDLATGRAAEAAKLPYRAVLAPDGRHVASHLGTGWSTTYEEDRSYALVVADAATGAPVWRRDFDGFVDGSLVPAAFPAPGRVVFRGPTRHLVVGLADGSESWAEGGYRPIAPTYLPDGAHALDRVGPDGPLAVVALATGAPRATLAATSPDARVLAVSPDGAAALVADAAGVGVWDLGTGERACALAPGCPPAAVACGAFAGGGLVGLGTREGELRVHESR
jgi:hypothetical protein